MGKAKNSGENEINAHVGPDAAIVELAGTGIRQTWRQWITCFRGKAKPNVNKFEEPWSSLWREGLSAAEAARRVKELLPTVVKPDVEDEPGWIAEPTWYVIERDPGQARIESFAELLELLTNNLDKGIPIIEGIRRQCDASVKAALEKAMGFHRREPSPMLALLIHQHQPRLLAFHRELFDRGPLNPGGPPLPPPSTKETPMARRPTNILDVDPHQPDLLDVKHPAHKKVASLVKRIRECDLDRSEAQEAATRARDELADVLHEHKLKEFRIGEHLVKLRPGKDKVSVRKAESDGGEDD
jgi:hypothetical protein